MSLTKWMISGLLVSGLLASITTSFIACDGDEGLAPLKTRAITIDHGGFAFDGTTCAARTTRGEAVVLLHGFPQTWHSYKSTAERLCEEGYRVLAFNQRGYSAGARPTEPGDYVIENLVADLFGVTTAAGLEKFHLVGHDWGAIVSWEAAMRDEQKRILSLTAISAPPRYAYMEDESGSGMAYIQRILAPSEEGGPAIDKYYDAEGQPKDPLKSQLLNGFNDEEKLNRQISLLDAEMLDAGMHWYRAIPLAPPVPPAIIGVRTLFIWGDADHNIKADLANLAGNYVEPEAFTRVVIKGAGHWIPDLSTDGPDGLHTHLLTHLRKGTPGQPE